MPSSGRLKNAPNEFSVDVCGEVCDDHFIIDTYDDLHADNRCALTQIDDIIRLEMTAKKVYPLNIVEINNITLNFPSDGTVNVGLKLPCLSWLSADSDMPYSPFK